MADNRIYDGFGLILASKILEKWIKPR